MRVSIRRANNTTAYSRVQRTAARRHTAFFSAGTHQQNPFFSRSNDTQQRESAAPQIQQTAAPSIARQARRAPRPTNHCGQTSNVSSLQHLIIQLWYQSFQPPLLREYEMPASMRPADYYPQRTEGGWADLEEYIGREEVERLSGDYLIYLADLVDPATHEMWEIMHPSDSAGQKLRQLSGYIARANFHCNPPPPFGLGQRLLPQIIPYPQRPLLIVTPIAAGLLQYRYGPEIERVPANVRDRVLERLLDAVRNQYTFVMPPELEEAIRAANPAGTPAPANPHAVENMRRQLVTAAGVATVATVATVVIRRAAWRHFWRVVSTRLAARGAAALLFAAADGPLPIGDLIGAGLSIITIAEILNDWSNLWARAEVIAQNEA